MSETANLKLPFILPSQAQKHVTHNEALTMLDALVQPAVLDRNLASAPEDPADGDRYIAGPAATGAWAGHDGEIAAWQDGVWTFYPPGAGWRVHVAGEQAMLWFDGAEWRSEAECVKELHNLALLGVGATADETNPFSAKLNKALWAARTAGEGGDGDLRFTMNKETVADSVSILFQTGWSGRAELGATGDDKFRIKTSADGGAWNTAFLANPAAGTMFIGADSASATTTRLSVVQEGSGSVLGLEKYHATSPCSFTFVKARGSLDAPGQVQPGDRLGGFFVKGWKEAGVGGNTAALFVRATEAYDDGAQGSKFEFEATPAGTTSRTPILTIDGSGAVRPSADNARTLGNASYRWSEVWAANGTIQTSDRRDKIVAGQLGFAAAMVDSVDPVLFRWLNGGNVFVPAETDAGAGGEDDGDGVHQPGLEIAARPGLRLHAGFIAQDLKAAMDQAGVDFGAWGLNDRDDPQSRQWTRPDQLIAVLWAALKQTRAQVAELRLRRVA